MPRTCVLACRLPRNEAEAVQRLADRRGVPVSRLIREAMHVRLFEEVARA